MSLRIREAVAKAALLDSLKQDGLLRRATIISELVVARQANRADIVLATDQLSCFEIKTARDKLTRLEAQLQAYERCFDTITVVSASKHLRTVWQIVPKHVGVMEMYEKDSTTAFRTHRAPESSPIISTSGLLDLLPASNIRSLLSGTKLPRKRADLISVAKTMAIEEVHRAVLAFLKGRYQASSRAFLSGARSQIAVGHIPLLTRLRREAATSQPVDNNRDHNEWAIYDHVGRSFGPVPADIARAFT